MPKCENCVLLEKFNNSFASFYQNSGPRKRNLLEFCLADNGVTCHNDYLPIRTFPVRWVQSHYDSNIRIFNNHRAYVLHLKQLLLEHGLKKETRQTISEYIHYLTHQNVLLTLCIQLDIQVTRCN